MEDRYLGDGVYASFDGYQIWLDTRAQIPVQRIALDPHVYTALLSFVEGLRQEMDAAKPAEPPGQS